MNTCRASAVGRVARRAFVRARYSLTERGLATQLTPGIPDIEPQEKKHRE